MDARAGFPLRALGIGEIFDRAITIYVRNFAVFTLIVLTLIVPLYVAQYFVLPDQTAQLQQVIAEIEHPASAAKEAKAEDNLMAQRLPGLFLLLLILVIFAPFVNNAVAIGVAAVYSGKRPDYRASYEGAFRRWPRVLGTAFLEGLIVLGVYVSGVVAVVMLVTISILFARIAWPLAIIGLLLTIVAIFALVLLLIVLLIPYAFGIYAVALEQAGIRHAIAESFGRVFEGGEIGKALLMGLAIVAIQVGVTWISLSLGFLALVVVKSYALQLAIAAVCNAVFIPFLAVILAVYYFDVRTRREGLDLEADLARLTSA